MVIRARSLAVAVVIGLVLGAVSCDGKPPTAPPPVPPPSGGTAPVSLVRIELVAPQEIAPGESVQLTTNAIKSDGSVENVSSQALWTPTDTPFLQLSSTGLATGKNRGTAFVNASFSGRSAQAQIYVVPKGTFLLTGTVKESGFGIEKVTVAVISGVGEGLTTVSGLGGSFALYGVAGPVRIHLKKDGYLDTLEQIDVTAHGTREFSLVAERSRKDYSGTYALTISAAASCGSQASGRLPDAAQRRTYTANVAQDEGRLTVTLTDADFIVSNGYGNRFVGFIDPTDTLTFPIGDAYYYYYYSGHFDIVEPFGATALMVNGIVTARGTSQLISGTLVGAILISTRATAPFVPYSAWCHSSAHGFEMVRR